MKEEIKKELESISPLLSKLEKKEQYELPFMYFDNLTDWVINEAQKENERAQKTWLTNVRNQFSFLKLAIGFGAVLFLISFWVLTNQENAQSFERLADDITPEEINTYIYENIDDFTLETIENMDIELSTLFEELESFDEELLEEILEDLDVYDLEDI